MTRPVSILLIAILAPLTSGLIYVAAPLLTSAQGAVSAEVAEHVERSRRLIGQFRENEERLAALTETIQSAGVDLTLSGDQVNGLLEEDRSILEEAEEMRRERTRADASIRRDLEERYVAAGGSDATPLVDARGYGNNLSAMAASIREAVKVRDGIFRDNQKLLREAAAAVDEALAVTVGEVSGADDPFANRLKGAILLAQSAADQRRAQLLRLALLTPRREMVTLAGEVHRLEADRNRLAASGIRDRIDELSAEADELRGRIVDGQSRLQQLDQIIADREQRIAALVDTANRARKAREQLEDQGVNLLDPEGSADFADRYRALSLEYRSAVADAQRLERGTLVDARIDDSRDYLHGRFVPADPQGAITVQRGLVDYRHDRKTVAWDLQGHREALTGVEMSIQDLDEVAKRYGDSGVRAKDKQDALRFRAGEVFAEFERIASEADANFDQARRNASGAIRAFRKAAGLVGTRVRDAREALEGVSPTKQDLSPFKHRADDKWLTGQVNNETAQANYLLASVLLDRYRAAARDAESVRQAREILEIAGADPAVFVERRDTARTDAAQAARDAVSALEKSSRDLSNNWTVAAQAGAAHYLLSLLENPGHIETAIINYDVAVQAKQNESDDPVVRMIAKRLAQLQNR